MGFWGKKEDVEPTTAAQPITGAAQPSPSAAPAPAGAIAKSDTFALANEPTGKSDPYGKVRSALGPGTVIQGRLSFDTVVSIDGKLGGEIFSSKALLVGKSGVLDAQIEAQVLIVRGMVRGTIKATERVELREGGQIQGDVISPVFVMDEGCIFNGTCSMPSVSSSITKTSDVRRDSKLLAKEPAAKDAPPAPEQIAIV